MCYPVDCSVCGKTTWAGCGQHVDDVQRQVPADRWCPGHDAATGDGAANGAGRRASAGGAFGRLFRRA